MNTGSIFATCSGIYALPYSHTGIAFGFERVSASKLASSEHTMQVVYGNSKPIFGDGFINQISISGSPGQMISEQKISFNDPTFRAAFTTKPDVWSYEREWRYVEETSGLFPWPGPIVSVVFGLKMPPNRRKHYARLVASGAQSSVAFYEMSVAANNAHFEMIPWSVAKS